MQVSYSRIDTFKKCPKKYHFRYNEKLTTINEVDPQSPLILGHALHTGIEHDIDAAINEYFNQYPVITDAHVTEEIKLRYWLTKLKKMFPANGLNEVKLENEDFIGFIDCLVNVTKTYDYCYKPVGTIDLNEYFNLYDFKYSNNIDNYLESSQLHLYKYYFEKLNSKKRIKNMYYVFVPKSFLRIKYKNKTNKRDETIQEFRKRVLEDLESKEIKIVKIDYNPNKVIDFLTDTKHLIECEDFHKVESRLCDWCEYQKICNGEEDYNIVKKE